MGPDLTPSADSKKTAYFRGRQLHGKVVHVPEGYRGVVVEKKDATAQSEGAPRPRDGPEVIDVDADAEEEVPLGALEAQAEFDEMVIWGHESVAEASADPYVRGVDEWMTLAEQVRVTSIDVRLPLILCVLNLRFPDSFL